VSATIIDLGRRGYIRIKEIEKEQGFESGSYEFKLVKVPPDKELTDWTQSNNGPTGEQILCTHP
jgi:hypothetical protein